MSNGGTVAATNVAVTDTLPAGLEPLDLPPGCSAGGQVVTCTVATLPPGSDVTIDVDARVDASAAGQLLSNQVTVSSDDADLVSDNDTSAASLTVRPLPIVDVGIEKTRIGSGTVPVGGEAVFRLMARNDGDAPGTDVEVRDTLPAGLTPVAADAGCTIDGQAVVCLIDTLGPGEQRGFEVRARAEPSAAGQTLTNRGTVTALATDPEPANNTSQAQVTIGPAPAAASSPQPAAGSSLQPAVQVSTECQSARRFTIRIRDRRARLVRSADVRVAGRRVAVLRRRSDRRLVAVIDVRGLPRGTYKVVITARLLDGRRLRWVRSYRTCANKLPPSNHLDDPGAL